MPRRPVCRTETIPILTLLLLAGCSGTAGDADAEARPPLVEAVVARAGSLPLVETVNGVVKAGNQVEIRPEISAPIVKVLVRSGEAVAAGQALVRLRDDELRERLRQAEADLRLTEAAEAEARARVTELELRVRRTRTLAEERLVSLQELETQEAQLLALRAAADQASARVDQARATADERDTALTKTVVRSPVAGRVGRRQAETGLQADPGTVLFVVGNLDQVMVEVPLTERMLDHVEAGMPVVLETRSPGREPLHAELSRISPFLAERSFTTIGEIDVENTEAGLRPGMFLTVRILYGQSERATLVPSSAVWEDPETARRGVFVVEEPAGLETPEKAPGVAPEEPRTVTFRPVEVLAEGAGTSGVAGVREGEWVVTVGQHMLRERAREQRLKAGEVPDRRPVTVKARVRPTSWERVQQLQSLQREDLLAGFLEKQQRIAEALGAEIPESEAEVRRVLDRGGTGGR